MFKPQEDVDDFMRAGGQAVRHAPTILDKAEEQFRLDLINEEVGELTEALKALGKVRGDLVADERLRELHAEALDGIVDSVYVIVGTASSLGYNFPDGWDEAHRSNMTKVDERTGSILKREDGKVLKPDHFSPANFERVIYGEDE